MILSYIRYPIVLYASISQINFSSETSVEELEELLNQYIADLYS